MISDSPIKWKAERLPSAYAVMYPMLCEVAREHGYALAIHGSMARDFDLIAVPWVQDASDALTLVMAMKAAIGACTHSFDSEHLFIDGNPSVRPHGRRAYSLHFTDKGGKAPYIDISVMPRLGKLATNRAILELVKEKK
jgi:hypothetical protein